MILAVLALSACLLQEPSIEELVQQLESDSIREREVALRKLKARGSEARPQLEKAARRADPEIAARAKRLLDLLALIDRESLTPAILAELPDLDEKLLAQGDQTWLRVFLDRVAAGEKSLKPETWAFLAPRAARSAKSVEDRQHVCEALVRIPILDAAPELVPYFLKPPDELRNPDGLLKAALKALTGMKARRELFRIVTEYGEMRSERRMVNFNLVREAFEALVQLQARAEILEIARNEDCITAADAAQALAASGDAEAIAELLKLLKSKNPWVRHHAALAMGRGQVRDARPALAAMLADPDGPALRGALDALARLGVREEIPRMIPLVHDERSWVQATAMRALAELDAKEAVPALQDILTHKDPAVRAVAADSLGRIRGRESIPELLPMLQDREAAVRVYVAGALCGAGSMKGLPLLVRQAEKGEFVSLNVGDRMSGGTFEYPPLPLMLLNSLRSPDPWKRYVKIATPAGTTGTILPDTGLFARDLGLTLALSPEVSALQPQLSERRYFFDAVPKSTPLSQVVFSFCHAGFELVFDGPALRLMTRAEALAEWKRWYLEREPADAEDRAVSAAFKEELRRATLPPEERAALEARDKADAKTLHRKERTRALEGVLTPGLCRYEDRLLDGGDDTWAQIGKELLAKPDQRQGLSEADLDVLIPRAIAAVKNANNQVLQYKKTEDQVALFRLAKKRASKDIPTWLQDLLQDPESQIRVAALNLLDPKLHAKEILGFAKDPSSGMRLVVAVLVSESYPRESLDLMLALSLDPEWGVSDRAAQYLQYRAGPEHIPHMIKLLKRSTTNDQAAQSALSYLGRHGAREAIPEILPLVEQEQGRCRYPALQTLLELGARESLPWVLGVLRKSDDTLPLAIPLIEAFDVRESLSDLHRVLERDKDLQNDFQKGKAVLTMARMGDRSALPTIQKLLRHEYAPLRAEACNALAFLDGVAAHKTVLEAFQDPDVTPMQALVLTNARESIPELSRRLKGEGAELITTLVDLDAREALPQIFAILNQPAAAYYSEGLRAAGRGFPAESLPSLRFSLAERTSGSPLYAAALLCEAGSTEAVPLLIERQWFSFSLNALRTPETWRKLRDRRLEGALYGSVAQLMERVAREAGLKLDGLSSDAVDVKAWTGRHLFLPKGARPLRLIEVIDRLEDSRWAFLLEKDTIRVLPREAALKTWSEWWASTKK